MIGELAAGGAGTVAGFFVLLASGLSGMPVASTPSAGAVADIPGQYLVLYQRASSTCFGLDWTVLAAVGSVESDHGRSTAPGVRSGANPAGAQGPMQFLPTTFAAYDHPLDADPFLTEPGGATPPSPYNPVDAIYAAARYLCASGVVDDVTTGLATYNCGQPSQACRIASAPYISEVLNSAAGYRRADAQAAPAGAVAVQAALAMLGTPYVWGGESPEGFDCSGLTQWAYAHAGIALPRTAQQQYDAGPRRPAGATLQEGDLVFFGASPTAIHHVGIYLGNGMIVDAPHRGALVRLDLLSRFTPPYIGATAPGSAR